MKRAKPQLPKAARKQRVTRREALSGLAAGFATLHCAGAETGAENAPLAPAAGAPGVLGTAGAPPVAQLEPAPPVPKSATDLVPLGATGLMVSRLAMGSGSFGGSGTSDQTKLGVNVFADLLEASYERGISFWETADMYGAHAHVGEGLRRVGRENIVLLTKSIARTREDMERDIARFLEELGTDYLDVVLVHQAESPTWTTERAGAMEALTEAKARGVVRAHGVSCHTLVALELAAETDWVEVDLARINPFGTHMDASPAEVIAVLDRMKAASKGVIGMKILGRFDEAIAHAVNLACIDCFTIGFTDTRQLDEVMEKIANVV
jgi:predicted oxidoreductase